VVEPKGDMIGKDTIYYYLNKQMSTLGVGFLSLQGGNNSVSSASISLAQLMRNINAISSELENIIKKFYKQILIDESLPPEYAPDIQIIDSEALEFELKTKLVELLYSKLNCSLKTALEVVGYDVNEELRRRKEENEGGYSEIFIPRQTSYTSNGDTEKTPGRPSGEDNNKTQYDQEYNKEART
jgi:hypothetical protein